MMAENESSDATISRAKLSPFKSRPASRVSAALSDVLVEISANVGYGECEERAALSNRMRFSAIDLSEKQKSLLEKHDDCEPKTRHEFGRYLDLVAVKQLKERPLSRLLSTHPLRRISRVKMRPKVGQKIELHSIELSCDLRQKRMKTVESLNSHQIESHVKQYEDYCGHDCDIGLSANSSQLNERFNDAKVGETHNIEVKNCAVVLPLINLCQICDDYLFNRSKHNALKRRYHSCRKGRINSNLSHLIQSISL